MKSLLTCLVMLFLSIEVHADDRGHLVLRAYVPLSINTQINQVQISSSKRLVTFLSQTNSRYSKDTQKFEVEGLDQPGLEAKMRTISDNDKTIQHELLVDHLKATMPTSRPIFLKISAN